MTAPVYQIEKISDFHAIPADKLGACLADFAHWLRCCRLQDELNAAATHMLGADTKFSTETMSWVDDGISGVSALDVQCEGKTIGTIKLTP